MISRDGSEKTQKKKKKKKEFEFSKSRVPEVNSKPTQGTDALKPVLEVQPVLLDAAQLQEISVIKGAQPLAGDAPQATRVDAVQVELPHGPVDPEKHVFFTPLARICQVHREERDKTKGRGGKGRE